MLKLSLLKTFVSVAESSSFTRAANEMYRSQSAISMQIKLLEDILQVDLFKRTGKAVTLSREGEIFLQYCHRIIKLVDEAVSSVRRESHAVRMVRLGCIEDYAGRLLPPILADFLNGNPNVQIEVKSGETAQLVSGLGRDHDIVVASHPAGSNEDGFLRTDQLVWARATEVELEQRVPLPIALRSGATLDQRWATAALDSSGRPWRCTYLPSGIGSLQGAVEDGLAIGVFKALTLPAGLKILGPEQGFADLPHIDVCIHVASESEDLPGVRKLADCLASALVALNTVPLKNDQTINKIDGRLALLPAGTPVSAV